jgi:hypothetical protein
MSSSCVVRWRSMDLTLEGHLVSSISVSCGFSRGQVDPSSRRGQSVRAAATGRSRPRRRGKVARGRRPHELRRGRVDRARQHEAQAIAWRKHLVVPWVAGRVGHRTRRRRSRRWRGGWPIGTVYANGGNGGLTNRQPDGAGGAVRRFRVSTVRTTNSRPYRCAFHPSRPPIPLAPRRRPLDRG